VPIATNATQQTSSLFDHVVGAQQKRFRDRQPECFRDLEVDDQLEFRRLLDRQVGRLRPAQNLIDKVGRMGLSEAIGATI
jgi:hypothetical protein